MQRLLITLLLFCLWDIAFSQVYDDYIGAGHTDNVTVTASDRSSDPIKSIDATGLDLDIQGASRFLTHATLGATIEEIEWVSKNGIEAWLDYQMQLPVSEYAIPTVNIIFELYDKCQQMLGDSCNMRFNINTFMWRYQWWHNTMRAEDKLRHRVALALSEVFVISDQSQLVNSPHGLAAFYDVLSKNAFGNYRDLIYDVTMNPAMGFYLSHFNNPRSIPSLNISPDENYAREIMQLFSIGLYELNLDGSRKVDLTTGRWLPTYDNEDIKGLASVFTGLSGGAWAEEDNNEPLRFGRPFFRYSVLDPMMMYDQWHEVGPKQIVGNYTIPGGQTGMQDINEALDHLSNHDNVGPFLALRLIQRLVKSNPTPGYIQRIATVFNDNGNGERGDLGAVVKAIFLDPEARECFWAEDMTNGVLRPPTERLTQMMIGLKAETNTDVFWNSAAFFQEFNAHHPLSAPTVFNHYRPDYVPNSEFAYYDYVGPEYQILNSSTSSNYVNYMLLAVMRDYLIDRYNLNPRQLPDVLNESFFIPYIDNPEDYKARLEDPKWLDLAFTPDQLVDYLDILLAGGNLSDETRTNIANSIKRDDLFDPVAKAHYALFLTMIHPDYLIMK